MDDRAMVSSCNGSKTHVSIVLPVHNEGERVYETLEAIGKSAGAPNEVVVVNDASS